jgi:uncharacterized RmlC-like cupin family protein
MRSAFGALLVSSALITLSPATTRADAEPPGAKRVTPSEIKWPAGPTLNTGTSYVAGIQTVVLSGDPTKPGLYTILVRLPGNTKIQAHSHPDDRVATVISGTWYFGYGDKFDETKLKALPAGSFYTEPPNGNHFAMTKDEGVVIQLSGVGPTGTKYVNPADDPSKR